MLTYIMEGIEFEKKVVKFIKKPTKGSNNRYYFHIPKNFIDFGLIDPDKTYTVYISPISSESKTNP